MKNAIEHNNLMKQRNYGIDLLRIVSMFMVVILHVLGQGGVLTNIQHLTLKGEIFWGIEIACYCAVNCYALISGYVGINSKHKYTSLISLCLQLVFYAVLITGAEIIIAQFNGNEVSLKTIIFHLLPSLRNYWYFSAYFCLFFFMPILNYAVHKLERRVLKKVAIFILIVFCGFNLVMEAVSGIDGGYSFLWLAILYVLGAYFAKYDVLKKISALKSLMGYFVCIIVTIVAKLIFYFITRSIFGMPKYFDILINYNSPTIVLASVFLVSLFSNLKMNKGTTKAIASIAPLSFGVYLIHCHPYLFGLMDGAFVWIAKKTIWLGCMYVFVIALCIFIACLIVDWIRSLIFRLCRIKRFAGWIEKVIGVVIGWFCKLLHVSLNEEENIEQIDKKTEPKLE